MKSNEYGYIGDTPTQSSSSNTGIFSNEDVYNLISENKWAIQSFAVSYLVVAILNVCFGPKEDIDNVNIYFSLECFKNFRIFKLLVKDFFYPLI